AAGTTGAAGTVGTFAPCTTCQVKVQYTCRSDDMSQISFVLDVTNESPTPIALSSLTLRYWYLTEPPGAMPTQVLECDFAKIGCTNVVTSADTPGPKFVAVTPPDPQANRYVEIAFKAGALNLDAFLNTGEIQLRVHNKDNSPLQQDMDYSFDCDVKGATIDAAKITAYIGGVLVWGTEPQ
ncbi:MAG TPA: cellulose binding domain-containing protein, partial [Polyangia bacterium]|nr:cellulose binding domain-containing protein [Polyangia bacterium]